MRAEVLHQFYDMQERRDRAAGEVFEATEERFSEIASALPGFVRALPEEPAPAEAPAPKAAPARRRAKAAE